jgi:predicted Zn-dependent peptidase
MISRREFSAGALALAAVRNDPQPLPMKFVAETGLRVLVVEDKAAPLTGVAAYVRAGAPEDMGANGIGNLTAHGLLGSNRNLSTAGVQQEVLKAGGSIESAWAPDYTSITAVTTRPGLQDVLYVISQGLKLATFEKDTLERARARALAEVRREQTDPFRIAYAAARGRVYLDSPYRIAFGGNEERLQKLTTDDVLAYYNRWFVPQRTVLVVVGNITLADVKHAVSTLFGDYDRKLPAPPLINPPERLTESVRLVRRKAGATSLALAFATLGVPMNSPDFPALQTLAALIGGGKSARLFRTVRDTAGVGYVVGAVAPPLALDGHLMAFAEFDAAQPGPDGKPRDAETVERLVLQTVRSISSAPPAPHELERAKRYAAGAHMLAHQRAKDRAQFLAWFELLGPGADFDRELPDRIAKVTLEEILRLAERLEHLVSVRVI